MPFPYLHRSKPLLDLLTILSVPRGSVATRQGSAQKFSIKVGREGKTEAIGLVTRRLWDLRWGCPPEFGDAALLPAT